MRFDQLDLNLLVALDALLELRSVSASARRLNLSQPAVSGALNRLRDYFSDPLLLQSGRQLVVTAKAEELVGPVRRALLQIRSEITRPGAFDPRDANRRFVIVASDYAFTILVADLLARVAELAPGVSFEIVMPDPQAAERMERAEVDLFFTVEPFSLPHHPSEELWRDEEVVVSWNGAEYGDLDEATFLDAGHAVVFFGSDRRLGLTERVLSERGFERQIDVMLPSFTALPQAILGTRRLASMHRRYAKHFERLYPIKLHPFPIELPPFVEIMQWHRARASDQGLMWLRGLIGQLHDAIAGQDAQPPPLREPARKSSRS